MQRGEIYSSQLEGSSGRRTYFFNLKVDRNGSPFLVIVESTGRPDGNYRRNQILVYPEDIESFYDKMDSLLTQFQKRQKK